MSTTSIQSWALGLSNQLKAIQTSWSDDDPQVRTDMLQQEVRRSLDRFSSHEREERVAALRVHFPVPDGGEVRVVEVVKESAARQVTADEALELLIKAAPQLSESQRRTYAERLLAAGYRIAERRVEAPAAPAAPQLFDKLPDTLARKLGIKGDAKVYPTQLFNVLLELVDCVLSVSTAASVVLTELRRRADEGHGGREEDLQSALAQYLADQTGGSADRMRLAVGRTRVRLAGFLKVPAELPRDLCERAENIAPQTIVVTVTRESDPGIMDNKWKLYWTKYEKLWKRDQWSVVQSSSIWEEEVARSVLRTVERAP